MIYNFEEAIHVCSGLLNFKIQVCVDVDNFSSLVTVMVSNKDTDEYVFGISSECLHNDNSIKESFNDAKRKVNTEHKWSSYLLHDCVKDLIKITTEYLDLLFMFIWEVELNGRLVYC